jgi:MFS family permease
MAARGVHDLDLAGHRQVQLSAVVAEAHPGYRLGEVPFGGGKPGLDSALVVARDRRAFVALFFAEVVSTTGSEMAAIALPWFVLITTGSPARMGAVMAAEFVGMALLGIPSTRPAATLGPRRTMLTSDLLRAPLVALIPILHWAGVLSLPVLLVIGLAVGAFFPAYASSQQLVLASLVRDDETRLTRVGGLLGSVNETASFAGPALGGLLVALIGPAAVLLIDAGSFLVAFVLVALLVPAIPGTEVTVDDRSSFRGLRYIARDRALLRRVIGVAIIEIGWAAMMATLPVLAFRRYGSGARLAGWFLASYGVGSVVGGVLSSRARGSSDGTATLAVAGMAAATLPLVFALPAWAVAVAVGANGVCSGLFFPRFFAAVTVRTPPDLRPTVMTSTMTAISSTGPLGFLGVGLLLQHMASPTVGFVLVAAAFTVGAAVVAAAQLSQGNRVWA